MPGLTRTRQVSRGLSEEAIAAMPAMDPGPVAEAAIEALGKKRSVIPGFKNRLMAFFMTRLPRGPILRKMGREVGAQSSRADESTSPGRADS